MVLTRIEVCDFKSYRGHQVIGPFTDFTCVIGPNGSGKSNLMDAISFVLGVKSAQLRSSQLKDLVYRGRRLESNEPSMDLDAEEEGEGTAQTAWVLAVYEDENKKEWRFQRTISMSGSSEYKLNGKVVTYTNYNAALIKHNILVKAKNFLVFQGDVEAVASQSSKDLTRLIEQISGSLELSAEYEKAKEEQERATENATFNFNKRRGINGEIKQYKEQKEEADRFETLCSDRDNAVLQRVLWKLWHIERGLEENANKIGDQNEALVSLRSDCKDREEELEAARADQGKARKGIIQREKKVKQAEQALDAKKPELLEIDTRIAHSTRKIGKISTTADQVDRDVVTQEEKLASLRSNLTETKRMADEAAAQAQALAAESNTSLSQESLEEYRTLKARANALMVKERQLLETTTRDEKTSRRSVEQLREQEAQDTERKAKLTEEEHTQRAKKDELVSHISNLRSDLATSKKELDTLQSERTRIARLEEETNEKLQDIYKKLLEAGVEKRESEREAKLKETLSNLQRIFPGVRGRLNDLCQPSARKYRTAVSVVLGRNIDAVIVDEERTAMECIEYMRNQRAGQATFIPLDTIQVKPVNDKYRSFAKGARLAVDVIQYDPAIERAVHHACGTALVCDTMEIARYICYEKSQEVKAVTLDGTIIHKSGLITGGRSRDETEHWTEQSIKGLQQSRDRLMKDLGELSKQKSKLKGDDNLIVEVSRLEGALAVANDDLKSCESRLTGIKEELTHVKNELKTRAPKLKQADKEHKALTKKLDDLLAVVHESEDGVFSDFCERIGIDNIRQYEQRQLRVAEQESEARVRYETQIARLKHQINFEDEQLQLRKDRLEKLRDTITSEEEALTQLRRTKTETEAAIADAEKSLEGLKQELREFNELQEDKNIAVENAKKAVAKATKALDHTLKEVSSMKSQIEKFAADRTGLYRKCRLENIPLPLEEGNLNAVKMQEEVKEKDDDAMDVDDDDDNAEEPQNVPDYGIVVNFEELDDEQREDGSPEMGAQLEEAIISLSADIEKMAPNMKASDRLEDVEAKLKETDREAAKTRNDSKSARDKFNELKKKRCELFNKAYVHISETIDQVYKDLTKGKAAPMGGVAYLSLEDNEEPYLGGIKYHAMPPMKRFRDMEQLSGGEKTVAALALLFAIHSYHPSPFFVLDEVDAALDNTNVAKIANYIKNNASGTFQFIVISLKGSLYERGHSLVGIYRDQDINSSKTLTLDLTQYDE